MSENNYECPKCHNVFPLANKFLHDNRCTESNPLPLNASRLVGINNNKKKDNQPIQHRPQPKITAQRRPDSHINPVDIKESIIPIPETFLCWLCGQTLPEKEKEDHMLCHKMQEEVDKYKKDIEKNNQQRPNERPHNQPRPNQNQQRSPQRPYQNQQRPPQRPNQNQYRPPQRVNQNQQRPPQRPYQNQQRPPQRPNQNQQRSNQRPNPQRGNQRNQIRNNNNNINIRRSFIPFDDIQIFDFNQIHESLNKMDNPTDIDILNELPETEIGDISKLDSEKRNCLICLENFQTGDKATMLPCIHMFHSNCIQEWLKSKNTCPLCKLKLTRDNL